MSDTLDLRERLVEIARLDRGKTEDLGHNQAEWIEKFWPATSYPDGYENAEPYCAAACCYWVREWLRLDEVRDAFGFTDEEAEDFRPKSAAVFDWEDWAHSQGLLVMDRDAVLHTADVMIFDCSHIGIVWTDKGQNLLTMEANTGPEGERDGDGAYLKLRSRSEARSFIRMLD